MSSRHFLKDTSPKKSDSNTNIMNYPKYASYLSNVKPGAQSPRQNSFDFSRPPPGYSPKSSSSGYSRSPRSPASGHSIEQNQDSRYTQYYNSSLDGSKQNGNIQQSYYLSRTAVSPNEIPSEPKPQEKLVATPQGIISVSAVTPTSTPATTPAPPATSPYTNPLAAPAVIPYSLPPPPPPSEPQTQMSPAQAQAQVQAQYNAQYNTAMGAAVIMSHYVFNPAYLAAAAAYSVPPPAPSAAVASPMTASVSCPPPVGAQYTSSTQQPKPQGGDYRPPLQKHPYSVQYGPGFGHRGGFHNFLQRNKRKAPLEMQSGQKPPKKKKKPLSQNIPLRKDWSVEDAKRALDVEKEFNKRHKSQSLIIKFPDLEINREIVQAFHDQIDSVHFQQPSTPRFCFVTLKDNSKVEGVIEELNKIKFGDGVIKVELKRDREEDIMIGPEDIDPLTLYVGNLAQEVTVEDVVKAYPKNRRIDIGFAKKMKYTRYAFVCFRTVNDAIEAFQNTHATEMYSKSLIVRFRRLHGTVGLPGEPKPQNSKRPSDEGNTSREPNESGHNRRIKEDEDDREIRLRNYPETADMEYKENEDDYIFESMWNPDDDDQDDRTESLADTTTDSFSDLFSDSTSGITNTEEVEEKYRIDKVKIKKEPLDEPYTNEYHVPLIDYKVKSEKDLRAYDEKKKDIKIKREKSWDKKDEIESLGNSSLDKTKKGNEEDTKDDAPMVKEEDPFFRIY